MAGESGIIEMKITSDSSEVRSDMDSLAASVNKGANKMIHDIDGVTTSHNNLLRSDHRVAAAMRGLTANAIASGNALTDAGAAMQALAMATNVSLPALIGLEVVGSLISKIAKAHSDAVKLNAELKAAGQPPAPGSPPPTKEGIAKTEKIIEESKASKTFQEHLEGILNTVMSPLAWLAEKTGTVGRNLDKQDEPGINPDGSLAYSDTKGAWRRGTKPVDTTWSSQMRPDNPAALQKQMDEDAAKFQQRNKKQDLADLTSAAELKAEAKKELEGMKISLPDLAKEGREWGPNGAGAGRLARQALKEQGLARKDMIGEHYDDAFRHQANADALKNQIVPLKDAEKDHLNAIQRAQVFKDMVQELKDVRRELSVADIPTS